MDTQHVSTNRLSGKPQDMVGRYTLTSLRTNQCVTAELRWTQRSCERWLSCRASVSLIYQHSLLSRLCGWQTPTALRDKSEQTAIVSSYLRNSLSSQAEDSNHVTSNSNQIVIKFYTFPQYVLFAHLELYM